MKMKSDYEIGKRDAKVGYYDKWYRHNRADEGAEYDKGYNKMMKSGKAAHNQQIIECM